MQTENLTREDFIGLLREHIFGCLVFKGKDRARRFNDIMDTARKYGYAGQVRELARDLCEQENEPMLWELPVGLEHLFDDDGELLTDKLTADDIVNCELLYTRVYTLESPAEISAYIMKIKQAAKALGLAGDFEKRIAPYKSEAVRKLKLEARAAHREQTGQTQRDLSDFPYIIEHENEQGDIYYTVSCPLLAEHIRQNCR